MRAIHRRVTAKHHVTIHWVPAHVGIQGNEHADMLADTGAQHSSIGLELAPGAYNTRVATLNLLVHHQHEPRLNPRKSKLTEKPKKPSGTFRRFESSLTHPTPLR